MKCLFKCSLILVFSFMLVTPLQACEICGCGNSQFQIGLLPNFKRGFMGVRYNTFQFRSSVTNDPTQFSHDFYHTIELYGGYQVGRFQFMTFLPFLRSRKVTDDGSSSAKGMGDMILMTNYKLWSISSGTFKQELWFGTGIKLPTGRNQMDPIMISMGDFNSQPGTGSLDVLINANHNMVRGSHGVVSNVTYRLNGRGPGQFQFGNRLNLSTAWFYTVTVKSTGIRPLLGLHYQRGADNRVSEMRIAGTSGYICSAQTGVNLTRGRYGLAVQGFLPFLQRQNEGQTKMQPRLTLGLTVAF